MIRSMADSDSRRDGTGSDYARLLGVGFIFLIIVGGLAAIGLLLDTLVGTLPLFLLIGLGLGFAGALYYVYLALKTLGDG